MPPTSDVQRSVELKVRRHFACVPMRAKLEIVLPVAIVEGGFHCEIFHSSPRHARLFRTQKCPNGKHHSFTFAFYMSPSTDPPLFTRSSLFLKSSSVPARRSGASYLYHLAMAWFCPGASSQSGMPETPPQGAVQEAS